MKCENYWPNRASIQYGNLLVTLEAEQLFAEFIVRSFTITAAKAKKVTTLVEGGRGEWGGEREG